MRFDVKKYKEQNDSVKLSENQKHAIVSTAKSSVRSSRRFPRWAKPIAAALAVLMLGGGIWLANGRQDGKANANMFSVTAYATESGAVTIDNSFKPVGELKPAGGGSIKAFDENSVNPTEEYIFKFMEFSFDCSGDNIESITYTANNGAFKIIESENVVDSKKSGFLDLKNEKKFTEIGVYSGDIVSSYTVKPGYHNYCIEDEPNICLAAKGNLMSDDCPSLLKQDDPYNFKTKEAARQYMLTEADYMLKDLSVDITVTYTDHSTETKTMVFESDAKILDWEKEPDGTYSYDGVTTIKAKIK